MIRKILVFIALLPAVCFGKHVRSVIFDTDWWTDVDDACAIRILLDAEKKGEINVCGIAISSLNETSVASLRSFLDYEKRPDMRIAVDWQAIDYPGKPCYHDLLIKSNPIENTKKAEDCVQFYRSILASAKGKIDIIVVGFPNTLARLLESGPDEHSDLDGRQLIKKKVNRLWMMAGMYPSGKEHNFAHNERSCNAAIKVTSQWPTKITFLGFEVGIQVLVGDGLENEDLLRSVMISHGSEKGRCAWDPITTYMAIKGSPEAFSLETVKGTCKVEKDGSNTFEPDPKGRHEYVKLLKNPSYYQNILNTILRHR